MPNSSSDEAAGRLAPVLAPGPENTLPADPGLARVVGAWPELPEHIKAAVLALVQTGR